jgi:TPR repeat protein
MRLAATAALTLLVFAAASCSRQPALNYKHCLKLRVGMSKDDMLKIMGAPEETVPYVEGKSLDYLKGRTSYEWSNPATMPGGDHVSLDEATGKLESIRCSNAEITASVYVEPPAPAVSTATAAPAKAAVAVSTAPAAPPPDLKEAVAAYSKKDFVGAARVALPLAQNGDPDAQLLAGLIFLNGAAAGQEKTVLPTALMWIYKSSRQKNAEAQAVYAAALMDNGTPAQTVVNETLSAGALHAPAGDLLTAGLYLNAPYPEIAPKDEAEGEKWLLLAAQGGSPTAQLALGRFERESKKDPVEAYRWTLAASGHPLVGKLDDPLHSLSSAWTQEQRDDAKNYLKELQKLMTPAQLKDAKNRAAAPAP